MNTKETVIKYLLEDPFQSKVTNLQVSDAQTAYDVAEGFAQAAIDALPGQTNAGILGQKAIELIFFSFGYVPQ